VSGRFGRVRRGSCGRIFAIIEHFTAGEPRGRPTIRHQHLSLVAAFQTPKSEERFSLSASDRMIPGSLIDGLLLRESVESGEQDTKRSSPFLGISPDLAIGATTCLIPRSWKINTGAAVILECWRRLRIIPDWGGWVVIGENTTDRASNSGIAVFGTDDLYPPLRIDNGPGPWT